MKTRMNTSKSGGSAKFSERLKIAMNERGMHRPVDLWKALVANGYTGRYQTVLYWIDGVFEPSLGNAAMIARSLGKTVEFFVS